MTTESTIIVEQVGAIRLLRLNRPERRNAIDDGLRTALQDAIDAAIADGGTAVVVIAGRGASFCAGADLDYLLSVEDPLAFLARVSETVTNLERCPKPVVAALHGHAVAGGLEIALACDVVIAAEGTMIGDGHLRNRLLPAAGSSVRLPQRVGAGLARRLLLSGELLSAESFLSTGWIQAVVPRDHLDDHALAMAQRLAACVGPTQQRMKLLLAEINGLHPADALEAEQRAFASNWSDPGVRAAVAAFLGERTPPTGSKAPWTAT